MKHSRFFFSFFCSAFSTPATFLTQTKTREMMTKESLCKVTSKKTEREREKIKSGVFEVEVDVFRFVSLSFSFSYLFALSLSLSPPACALRKESRGSNSFIARNASCKFFYSQFFHSKKIINSSSKPGRVERVGLLSTQQTRTRLFPQSRRLRHRPHKARSDVNQHIGT